MEDVVGGSLGPASTKLRDRVLKDARVLPNKIIDVSKFMDSQVDVNLMDDCAQELVSDMLYELTSSLALSNLLSHLDKSLPFPYRPLDSCKTDLPRS